MKTNLSGSNGFIDILQTPLPELGQGSLWAVL